MRDLLAFPVGQYSKSQVKHGPCPRSGLPVSQVEMTIAVASLSWCVVSVLEFHNLHVSYHKGTMGFDRAPQHGRPQMLLAEVASALRRAWHIFSCYFTVLQIEYFISEYDLLLSF